MGEMESTRRRLVLSVFFFILIIYWFSSILSCNNNCKKISFFDFDQKYNRTAEYDDDEATTTITQRRQLNILALGGSKTYGSGVLDSETYVYQLGKLLNATANNLGIPASGSEYPSSCIQSILRDNHHYDTTINDQDIIYDVVVLEFSTNDSLDNLRDSLRVLARRIRTRYPNALIIYLHSYHFGGYLTLLRERNAHNKFIRDRNLAIKRAIKEVGGIVYSIPKPKSIQKSSNERQWFMEDLHHFSTEGHLLIAKDLERIIKEEIDININLLDDQIGKVGSWGRGDKCYSWFQTGQVPSDIVLSGGVLSSWPGAWHAQRNIPSKYAYEVSSSGIQLDFPAEEGARVYLNYMSIGKTQQYPSVHITGIGLSSRDLQPDNCLETFM